MVETEELLNLLDEGLLLNESGLGAELIELGSQKLNQSDCNFVVFNVVNVVVVLLAPRKGWFNEVTC